ncbi:MAG: SMP-30/gluconolactonase/LRE family protein [Nitrososphaeraceae archaeon]
MAKSIDKAGNLYVVDAGNDRIQKFDSNGNYITKWGTTGSGDGQLSRPIGMAIDSSGNIYVCDSSNNRIQKFDSNGNYITKWSVGSPAGIAIDQNGKAYVINQNTGGVEIYSLVSS